MNDDFSEWWGWYLTDEQAKKEEEIRKKRLDELNGSFPPRQRASTRPRRENGKTP